MQKPVRLQILDYPGSQKSANWGMKDVLDHADAEARTMTSAMFECSIVTEPHEGADVYILPPALLVDPPELPPAWRDVLLAHYDAGGVLASVCSGAFLLAETGLLDGRQVTTHWRHATALRQRHPDAIIDTNRILVDLGAIITAGGVMAWTDLTLHLIQRFGGRKLMLDVARMFIMDPADREQSYYAQFVPDKPHSDQAIAAIQNRMQKDPGVAHTIGDLAAAAGMSERSLMRRFKLATGKTPIEYLQLLRVEVARSRLELTRDSFDQVSWDVGYGDPAAFRRIFKRVSGLAPSEYRRRFGMGRAFKDGEDTVP